jgi:hypothetical protein
LVSSASSRTSCRCVGDLLGVLAVGEAQRVEIGATVPELIGLVEIIVVDESVCV